LDVAREDVHKVESGLAVFGEVYGGLVGDDFGGRVSFEDICYAFGGFV
jgi:hypothetical protein